MTRRILIPLFVVIVHALTVEVELVLLAFSPVHDRAPLIDLDALIKLQNVTKFIFCAVREVREEQSIE